MEILLRAISSNSDPDVQRLARGHVLLEEANLPVLGALVLDTCAVLDSAGRGACRLYPVDVLMLNLLDASFPLLELFHVELALFVGEVLPLDASPHDLLVFVVHAETGSVGVVVRPLVPFERRFFLDRLDPDFLSFSGLSYDH
jgi:hypothetical protein